MLLFAACGNDTDVEGLHEDDGLVGVRLHVAAAATADTRAEWQDKLADDDEMMNVWTVVVVGADNHVQRVLACRPTDAEREIDNVVYLAPATYRFYSFANIAPARVLQLLNIGTEATAITDNNTIHDIPFTDGATITEATANAIAVQMNGNQFNPEATDNGFGAQGIPMSNVQTIAVGTVGDIDLIVIRLLAKLQFQFTNKTGAEKKITQVSLSDITANSTTNLMLLPRLTNGRNTMEYVHGDLQPNLVTGAPTTTMTLTPDNLTIDNDETKTLTVYVNESAKPQTTFGRFFIELKLDGEGTTVHRYALIDDANATDNTGRWDYIARNDYRRLPILIDDYTFELIPYDFPPIGVYPASVKEEDGLQTITFHDYGHFHLVPVVTQVSTGERVAYNSGSGIYWTLSGGSWADAWTTYDSYEGTVLTSGNTADPPFYRMGSTATRDADENGGVPVFDTQTTWNGFSPFIFGYIADPGDALTADRTIYHEMTITLHRGDDVTPAERQMTARLLMILDTVQMLYARAAGARRHH